MTNEEKILNAFPNATARIIENKDFRYIEVEQDDKWIADFNLEWWNSEYKEPKTGEWIEEINDYGEVTGWHCDKCYEDSGFTTDCKWDYCPNCGAKMD